MPPRPPTPEARLPVPGDQVDALRSSLLELYQVCADALNHAATRQLQAGDALASLAGHRGELASLERLLAQLGWPGEPATGPPPVLTGPPGLLREAAWLALIRATAALDEAAQRGAPLGELTTAVEVVAARIALLAEVERS
jgi:hypothetical protein